MGQSPQTNVIIEDFSKLALRALKGVACVQGITTKGSIATPILIQKWEDFLQIFGGYHPQSMFPFYCERALRGGAKLYVSRVASYTDIEDKTSYTGTNAIISLDNTNTIRAKALYPGIGYNGVRVVVVSTSASTCTITVKAVGMEDQILANVSKTPTEVELTAINQAFQDKYREKTLIYFVGVFAVFVLPAPATTVTFPVADVILVNGAQTLPNANDYNGSVIGGTGWHSFNEIVDSKMLYNFDAPIPAIDAGLAQYCINRKDMRFVVRTPMELNSNGMEDYRMGTGAYSHPALDTYLGKMVVGEILVFYNGVKTLISGIADVCALEQVKTKEWFVAAGLNRGVLPSDVQGCPYNLLSPALADNYDAVYEKGINAVGIHRTKKAVYWGNRTLLLDQTKLLKYDNVADLAMYIRETLQGILELFNFEPNDLRMYEQIFVTVKPFIERLEAERAIHPGKWQWNGDQFASSVEDLQFNTPDDLQQGRFSADFLFAPIVANEIIAVKVGVSDLGAFAVIA